MALGRIRPLSAVTGSWSTAQRFPEDNMKTQSVNKRAFYMIGAVDAGGKTLGRLSTQIANRLRGKHNKFTPHVDTETI